MTPLPVLVVGFNRPDRLHDVIASLRMVHCSLSLAAMALCAWHPRDVSVTSVKLTDLAELLLLPPDASPFPSCADVPRANSHQPALCFRRARCE